MSSDADTYVEGVVSKSKLFMNHPGQTLLGGDIYASVHSATVDLQKRQVFQGRYKTSANSLNFGAVSSFVLTPGTTCGQCFIFGTMVMPQHARAGDGWMYDLVDYVEIIIGNSSISNLRLSGKDHFNMVMLACPSMEKRNALLQASPAFNLTSAGATVQGGMALYLPWSSPELRGAFGFDLTTIQSNIYINISWKPAYKVISGSTGNAITLPAGFTDLYLRQNNQVQFERMLLADDLARNPERTYSIPNIYCTSYAQPITLTNGVEASVTLSAITNGMMQFLAFSLTPSDWVGASSTLQYANGLVGIPISSCKLEFDGQTLYECNYDLEDQLQQVLKNDGASCDYQILNTVSVAAASTNGLFRNRVHLIPMGNEISQILRQRRHENLPSYGGSSLVLKFTPSALGLPYTTSDISRSYLAIPTGATYTFNCVFGVASLLQVSGGNVSQQLG